MPELPDIEIYRDALSRRIVGQRCETIRLASPFLLRTIDPPVDAFAGRNVQAVARLGKRIVIAVDAELFIVIHLMISGRLHWHERGKRIPGKVGSAAFDFSSGTLILTEAATKKRAALHLLRGEESLHALDPGGLDVLKASLAGFTRRLRLENHTLKRALTDPRLFSGIGNSFSDEILHRARLSPFRQTGQIDDEEAARLYAACRAVLREWLKRLRDEVGTGFPEKVTAFREGMAVHGRYGRPCPDCGSPVQRIRYAENEANYCARCQTGGRLLADRALSRLLKSDWPRTLEELEERRPSPGTSDR